MRWLAWALALLLSALAGCGGPAEPASQEPQGGTGTAEQQGPATTAATTAATTGQPAPGPNPAPPSPKPAPQPAAPASPRFTECEELVASLQASPYRSDAAWFPPGFTPRSQGVQSPVLVVFRCAGAVLGNETVLADVRFAAVLLGVDVATPAANPGVGGDALVVESFASDARLVASLREAGFQTREAAIAFAPTDQGPDAATIAVAGATWYTATQAAHTLAGGNLTSQERWHDWGGVPGSETWLDFAARSRRFDSFATPVALDAAGGRLRDMAGAGPAAYAGVATLHVRPWVDLTYRPT